MILFRQSQMQNLIKNNIGGKKIIALLIITNSLYVLMLAVTIPTVMHFSGGMKILDMMPLGYDPGYVNTLLNALGEKGRQAYLYNQIPVDLFFPFFSGITYCLLIAFFLNKLGKLNGNYFIFCFVPLFAGLFDYCENTGIISMLRSYPGNSILLSQITNVFSVLKSSFTTFYLSILIILLIIIGMNKFLVKRK